MEMLTNLLTNKKSHRITFQGKITNAKNGYTEHLGYKIDKMNPNISYDVSLINFEADAVFPNISKGLKNDKFYYINKDDEPKELTIYTGAYEVDDYNNSINLPDIKFSIEKSTGRTKLDLKNNHKVDFTKADTFVKELGFEEKLYEETCISKNPVDLFKTKHVFIYCDLVSGSYYKKERDHQILYGFANNYQYGEPIIEPKHNNKATKNLGKYEFSEINVKFKDQDLNPLDLGGYEFIIEIDIRPS